MSEARCKSDVLGSTSGGAGVSDAERHHMSDQETVVAAEVQATILEGLKGLLILGLVNMIGGAIFCAIEEWDYNKACFFTLTLFTTVGYGSFAPETDGGKSFVVIFSLFTIPIAGFVLNAVAHGCICFVVSMVSTVTKGAPLKQMTVQHRLGVATMSLFMHLLICGGLVFSLIEDWSYGNSVYFCFVSLTTIGLGDFAPKTKAGWAYSVFFLLTGLGIITIIIEDSITVYFGTGEQDEDNLQSLKSQLEAKDTRIRELEKQLGYGDVQSKLDIYKPTYDEGHSSTLEAGVVVANQVENLTQRAPALPGEVATQDAAY